MGAPHHRSIYLHICKEAQEKIPDLISHQGNASEDLIRSHFAVRVMVTKKAPRHGKNMERAEGSHTRCRYKMGKSCQNTV